MIRFENVSFLYGSATEGGAGVRGIDLEIPKEMAFAAEIGLSGEVRPASRTEQRVSEAAMLGFKTVVVSKYAKSPLLDKYKIDIVYLSKVEEIIRKALKA